jgi:hypothetical protein
MKMRSHFYVLSSLILLFQYSCTDSGSGGRTAAADSSGSAIEGAVTVTGQLALDSTLQTSNTGEQKVSLTDESGAVIAEGVTTEAGTFAIAINSGSSLTASAEAPVPRFLYVKSLFLVPEQQSKTAVGAKDPIVLDARDLKVGADGVRKVETGDHAVRKVGAVAGAVTLETGDSAVGIDIFVPGTTHIAKTDAEGNFLLGFLPRGTYLIRAEKDGFASREWTNVAVGDQQTVDLGSATLQISTGPQINSFTLHSLDATNGRADLRLRLAKAAKYRISKSQDFSDTVFKPVDITLPEIAVDMEFNPSAKLITIYLEAADSDGLSATSQLVIDLEAPSAGSVRINNSNAIANSASLPLALSATGATRMKFAEAAAGLTSANWEDFASTYTYTLQSLTEGQRRIYVAFADNAGNITGANGEISAEFTLDRTAPDVNGMTLLFPETPTGAFNTPLAWLTNYPGETNLSFDIEVCSDVDCSDVVRDMTSTTNNTIISPPLASAGTYYWRVRPHDAAGNIGDWVYSGNAKKFKVQLFATGYLSKRDISGEAQSDLAFARSLNRVDANTIAVSVGSHNDANDCPQCGIVKLLDLTTREFNYTLTENLDRSAVFGQRVVACDLDNDGTDEIAVSAPGMSKSINGVSYNNAGAVFVYKKDGTEWNRLASLSNPMTGTTAPIDGYSYCTNWNEVPCTSYGYPMWVGALDYTPYVDNARFFGWDLSCKRDGGADALLVGEPGYASSASIKEGAVWELTLSGDSLSPSILATGISAGFTSTESHQASFGGALAYSSNFTWPSCTDGAYTGPALIIGTPRLNLSSDWQDYSKGAFSVFKWNAGTLSLCETVLASGAEFNSYDSLGTRIFNLGNIDADVNGTDELAVSALQWDRGIVKIYGSSTYSVKKNWAYFGYAVVPVGEWTGGSGIEIAISSPQAQIVGQWGAGKINIFTQANLSDAGSSREIIGQPSSGAALGAAMLPADLSNNSFTDDSILVVAAPGRSVGGTNGVGQIQLIGKVKLSASLPSRIAGTTTGARLGKAVLPVGDIDQDSVPDFVFSQPGLSCSGMRSGVLSFYSVAAAAITNNSCPNAYPSESLWGTTLMSSTGSDFYFSKYQSGNWSLQKMTSNYLIQPLPTGSYPNFPSTSPYNAGSYSRTENFVDKRYDTGTSQLVDDSPYEYMSVGNPTQPANKGSVSIQRMESYWNARCSYNYNDADNNSLFGTSTSFIVDSNADGIRDIVVGAPGITVGSNRGAVFLLKGKQAAIGGADSSTCSALTNACGCWYGSSWNWYSTNTTINVQAADSDVTIKRIDANAAPILAVTGGQGALSGFGTQVVGLPDLDGSLIGGYDAFVYVANTNSAVASSTAVAEYFILAYKNSDQSIAVIAHEIGAAGSMLGGNVRVINDIDGDSIAELAISCSGCQGRLGNTGNVKILSGKKLTEGSIANATLQMLYNPDPLPSNFGTTVEYADITGDGIADFVVGADQFGTSVQSNLGAVYIFRIDPIQEGAQ